MIVPGVLDVFRIVCDYRLSRILPRSRKGLEFFNLQNTALLCHLAYKMESECKKVPAMR